MTEVVKPTAIQRAAECQMEIDRLLTKLATCMIVGDDAEVNADIRRKITHAKSLTKSATGAICSRHRLMKRGKLN